MANFVQHLLARHIIPAINQLSLDAPVVVMEGPRSVGKSAILAQLAHQRNVAVLDLDDLATRNAVKADPDLAVAGVGPVCIDEYQKVPAVPDVIKAELNRGASPGRFFLTGSARHDALPRSSQALTGRMARCAIYPLSQGEIHGVEENFVARAIFNPSSLASTHVSTTTRSEYAQRVFTGGFPLALRSSTDQARRTWFDNYLKLSLERDVLELSNLRQLDKLGGLMRRLVGQTGQLLNISGAGAPLGLTKPTAESYVVLLEKLFLVYRLEAWGKTLYTRALKTPKVHVFDSGVGARLLRLTPNKIVAQNPTALSEYGHLLESFAVSELLKQASWSGVVADVGHFRTKDNEEVDLVLESDQGDVVGVEVKAGRSVNETDLAGLRQLKKVVGSNFLGGIILNTGPRSYALEPQMYAVPLDRLWQRVGE